MKKKSRRRKEKKIRGEKEKTCFEIRQKEAKK